MPLPNFKLATKEKVEEDPVPEKDTTKRDNVLIMLFVVGGCALVLFCVGCLTYYVN